MKLIIILTVCVTAYATEYYNLPQEDFTPAKLMDDIKEVKARLDCYLGRRACSPKLEAHKNLGEDAVRTACAKCTPEMKRVGKALLEITRERFPEDYRLIRAKYDPSGQYFSNFEKELNVSPIAA